MKAKSSYCVNDYRRIAAAARSALLGAAALALCPAALAEAQAEGAFAGFDAPVDAAVAIPLGGMDERVSLDLRSTEVTDALKYLATKGGLNIAISKNVSGRVNLFLTDVPIRDVFDLILRSNELAYDMQGNVFNVMTEAEYRALYGRKFADLRRVETFRLQYAVPEQAFNLLDTLKSDIGRLLVDEESGTVMVMDTPDNLKQMESALSTMETESTVQVFDLRYAKAVDVEERLKADVDDKKLGYVKADARTNQLIIKTLPSRMAEMETLVRALDRKTRQVLIDAKIVKVNLTDELNAGIDWNEVFENLVFHGLDTANTFRSTLAGTAPSEVPAVAKLSIPEIKTNSFLGKSIKPGKLAFGTVSRDGYELFRFLQTLGETKVMSNPRLLVTENQEARIHVGTKEAYVTTTTTTGQTTTTTAEEVEFIDVGIQFLVTPTINADGYVTMKIKPEVSSVVRTLETPSGNTIPIVDTSTAETNVVVMDGRTVIIGGLRKNERLESDAQVPYMGKLPLIGNLFFRKKTKDNELAELVVFITPHIVHGDTLVTGDETPQDTPIKTYRDYQSLFPDSGEGSAQ